MAIVIDHLTRVIYLPQADLTPVGAGIYELDVNSFRQWLKDWEDGEIGVQMPDTHRHNTQVTLGGVTLARTVEIINGYMLEFEDGQYAVRLTGANNNLADVLVVNQVSLRSNNSAGLIVTGGADPNTVADAVLQRTVEGTLDLKSAMRLMMATLLGKVSGADNNTPVFRDTNDTKNRVSSVTDDYGNRTSVTLDPS